MCSKISSNIPLKTSRIAHLSCTTSIPCTDKLGMDSSNISFGAGAAQSATLAKKGLLYLRRLCSGMSEASEITNSLIAAVGTGVIAPFFIMQSPPDKEEMAIDKEKAKEKARKKNFFQAIRQIPSAGLQLAFQLPMTILSSKVINYLAYEKGRFKDTILGKLIPEKAYLARKITPEEYSKIETSFNKKGSELQQELRNEIIEEYKEVGIEPEEKTIEKLVRKRKKKFLRNKLASQQREKLIDQKCEEISRKPKDQRPAFVDTELVTKDQQMLAMHREKEAFREIERIPKYKLTWVDKLAKWMGFSTKRLSDLKDAKEAKAKEIGISYVNTELAKNKDRLRQFIEAHDSEAQKLFKNKRFFISLFINLFMVSASCCALNWLHPKFNNFLEKHLNKKEESQKVEVKA